VQEERHEVLLLLENGAATAAHVKEFHPRFCRSLLGLKKYCLHLVATGTLLIRSWQRRITSDILGHTGRFAYGIVEVVSENTGGRSGLAPETVAADILQGAVGLVLLRVEHV